VSALPDQVNQRIRTHQLLGEGQRILVAVSGGVDSMVLLHVLHDLAPSQGWQLVVAHLNHQLRGRSSNADERLVRRTAAGLKLPLVAGKVAVKAFARARRLSLEMAARELRHSFLARVARKRRIPVVVLAHHADDQVELFFLRLLRGGGGAGLSGMKWRTPSPSDPEIALVRPLLDLPKAALVAYAAECGVPYREDASNAALNLRRNRIRHELLPLLRRKYQRALDKTILRVMEIVGADAEFAAQAAREWLGRRGNPKSEIRNPKCVLRRARHQGPSGAAFDGLPLAVQRRCLQLQLLSQGIAPEYGLVERLRAKADRPVAISGASALRYAVRDGSGRVRLQVARPDEFIAGSMEVNLGGRTGEAEFGGVRVRWRIGSHKAARPAGGGADHESFDADKVGRRVRLRHWQPGDRFHPIGMGCPVKLQDFFTNQKVPRGRRRQLIVAEAEDGQAFWVEGLRISERFKLTGRTIRRLQWRWKRL
jgi:tRNA(Ile)-lysidine synthase